MYIVLNLFLLYQLLFLVYYLLCTKFTINSCSSGKRIRFVCVTVAVVVVVFVVDMASEALWVCSYINVYIAMNKFQTLYLKVLFIMLHFSVSY